MLRLHPSIWQRNLQLMRSVQVRHYRSSTISIKRDPTMQVPPSRMFHLRILTGIYLKVIWRQRETGFTRSNQPC